MIDTESKKPGTLLAIGLPVFCGVRVIGALMAERSAAQLGWHSYWFMHNMLAFALLVFAALTGCAVLICRYNSPRMVLGTELCVIMALSLAGVGDWMLLPLLIAYWTMITTRASFENICWDLLVAGVMVVPALVNGDLSNPWLSLFPRILLVLTTGVLAYLVRAHRITTHAARHDFDVRRQTRKAAVPCARY